MGIFTWRQAAGMLRAGEAGWEDYDCIKKELTDLIIISQFFFYG